MHVRVDVYPDGVMPNVNPAVTVLKYYHEGGELAAVQFVLSEATVQARAAGYTTATHPKMHFVASFNG